MHRPILETSQRLWADESACARDAAALAGVVAAAAAADAAFDARIELDGPLGAGKTTLVRHLLRALGVAGRVKSPTYALVEPYTVALPGIGRTLAVLHADFYRFSDPREWNDAGLRDANAEPGLKLAEWAQQAHPHLPDPDLRMTLEPLDERVRRVQAQAFSPQGLLLLHALAPDVAPA